MAQKYLVRVGDGDVAYEIEREAGTTRVRREGDDNWQVCELERVGDSGLYVLMLDSHPVEIYLERRRGGAVATIGRHIFETEVTPWRPNARRAHAGAGRTGMVRVVAPMTGSIVEVRCDPGQTVARGDVLLVIESMKMNNELRSPAAGVVDQVPVIAGQRVGANDLLVAIRAGEA